MKIHNSDAAFGFFLVAVILLTTFALTSSLQGDVPLSIYRRGALRVAEIEDSGISLGALDDFCFCGMSQVEIQTQSWQRDAGFLGSSRKKHVSRQENATINHASGCQSAIFRGGAKAVRQSTESDT